MKRTRLGKTTTADFLQAWELYEDAFPEEERRELNLQQQIMHDANYHFDIITDNGSEKVARMIIEVVREKIPKK
ncbi:hypothetical protein BZG01_15250 [Labilibaculum manganireducens]|uniref:Uncharacterized protein n=1 Tax=Labilibaculum manganireducens TaxID=1940525 RepID=A0A2N3I156_9BACT|nr:hypothetical protein [Labilibaculum manganireducens]PKQ64049.1 hypothetical protein BZG01_15250 [Labilibaculum manganireducens]